MSESIDILVIDDLPELLQLVEAAFLLFCEKDVRLHKANSGYKGVSVYKKVRPDMVLTDYEMKDGNGSYVIKEVKSLESNTPVILMSSHNDGQAYAKQLGADGFIEKPFNIRELPKQLLSYAKNRK